MNKYWKTEKRPSLKDCLKKEKLSKWIKKSYSGVLITYPPEKKYRTLNPKEQPWMKGSILSKWRKTKKRVGKLFTREHKQFHMRRWKSKDPTISLPRSPTSSNWDSTHFWLNIGTNTKYKNQIWKKSTNSIRISKTWWTNSEMVKMPMVELVMMMCLKENLNKTISKLMETLPKELGAKKKTRKKNLWKAYSKKGTK